MDVIIFVRLRMVGNAVNTMRQNLQFVLKYAEMDSLFENHFCVLKTIFVMTETQQTGMDAQTIVTWNSDLPAKEEMRHGMTLAMKPVGMEGTFILKAVTMETLVMGMDVITLHVMFHEDSVVLTIISNQEVSKRLKELGGVLINAMKFAEMVTTLNFTTVMMGI